MRLCYSGFSLKLAQGAWERNMKKLGMIAAFAMFMLPTFAQAKHSLGFAAGSTYGIGLSYALDLDSGHGFQLTGLPYWNDEDGMIAGGLNYRYTLHQNGRVGIYGSYGLAGMLAKSTHYDCVQTDTPDALVGVAEECTDVEELDYNIATGPGVGLQMYFWDNLVVRFELPLTLRYGTDGWGITPIPNFALMYRWGD